MHIPASRMKMRVKHIVPLSAQALAILRGLGGPRLTNLSAIEELVTKLNAKMSREKGPL